MVLEEFSLLSNIAGGELSQSIEQKAMTMDLRIRSRLGGYFFGRCVGSLCVSVSFFICFGEKSRCPFFRLITASCFGDDSGL